MFHIFMFKNLVTKRTGTKKVLQMDGQKNHKNGPEPTPGYYIDPKAWCAELINTQAYLICVTRR